MNLHSMAKGYIGIVNPNIPAVLQRSIGYTTLPSGKQVPQYTSQTMDVQMQSLTADDLRQLDSLNIQSVMRSIYLDGDWRGVVRKMVSGGDKFIIGSDVWLVVHAFETWPDWSKVAVVLQTDTV